MYYLAYCNCLVSVLSCGGHGFQTHARVFAAWLSATACAAAGVAIAVDCVMAGMEKRMLICWTMKRPRHQSVISIHRYQELSVQIWSDWRKHRRIRVAMLMRMDMRREHHE